MKIHESNKLAPDFTLLSVLRTSPEPFTYFSEAQVHDRLTEQPGAYLQFVKRLLASIATGHARLQLPPKQLFTDTPRNGDFRVMPCVVEFGETVTKTVKLVGTNLAQVLVKDQITVGKAFALHPTENYVSHIFEACLLSSARTGLCAALAIDLLADEPRKLTVVGAGRVGYYAAFYAATLGSFTRVEFIDQDLSRAEAAARALADNAVADIEVVAVEAGDLSGADVIVLATTSTVPFCHPDATPARLVISLGADTDEQSELDPCWAREADIFVDVMDSARYGDLKKWLEMGLARSGDLTDFNALLAGAAVAEGRRRVFISTGSALFDNLTIAYLLDGQC